MSDIYADAFENILAHGGVVRIDLASYDPKETADGDRPTLEVTGRLVVAAGRLRTGVYGDARGYPPTRGGRRHRTGESCR